MTLPLLTVNNLTITHPGATAPLVSEISLGVHKGQCTALVGESGAGKTLIMRAIAGILPDNLQCSGEVNFEGVDLARLPESGRRSYLGRWLGVSFQEPSLAFNPVYRIRTHLAEALTAAGKPATEGRREDIHKALARVGFDHPELAARSYPHELSGGMRQRAMLAMALAGEPSLLLADEPASAQDPVTRRNLVQLLQRLVKQDGLAMLLITHELSILPGFADRVIVLLHGRIMEEGPLEDVLNDPCHPYTRLLLDSRPERAQPGEFLQVPDVRSLSGNSCPFASRCGRTTGGCQLRELHEFAGGTRRVRCQNHGA